MAFQVKVMLLEVATQNREYTEPVSVRQVIDDAHMTADLQGKEVELTTSGFDGFVTNNLDKMINAKAVVYIHKNHGGAAFFKLVSNVRSYISRLMA